VMSVTVQYNAMGKISLDEKILIGT